MRWREITEKVGDHFLYHGTSGDLAAKIIMTNKLAGTTSHSAKRLGKTGGQIYGVSLTRSYPFAKGWGDVVFVIDWMKLKHRYDIRQIDYYKERSLLRGAEAEEFVLGTIESLDRYLIEIRITQHLYDYCVADNEEYTNPEEDSRYWPLTSHPLLKIV